jgi:CRP-like cAMP-binding protein
MSMDLATALSRHPELSQLNERDRALLADAFTVGTHGHGHPFLSQGERPSAAWLVLDGEVTVTRAREPYIDELVRLGPGEMFGLASLVGGVRRSATCTAAGPVTAARIDKSTLDVLMREHAPVGLALQRAVMCQLASDFRKVASDLRELLAERG